MLINLLNTILITCGMAVNTTNFNSIEKQPRKNLEDETPLYIYDEYQQIGQTYTYNIQNEEQNLRKYYIGTQNSYTYNNPYININNTAYTNIYNNDNTLEYGMAIYQCLEISSYFNTVATARIELVYEYNGATGNVVENYRYYTYDNSQQSGINLTLNSTTLNTLQSIISNATLDLNKSGTSTIPANQNQVIITLEIEMQPYEQINILYVWWINSATQTNYMFPRTFKMQGNIQIPQNNLEIVDIPSLMLTVLTLPFSFISQAFNLTIFPNTAYSINFSNLFRTIIAIFILLWIIKKIFK